MTEVLTISNLTKSINNKAILHDINLTIPNNQLIALSTGNKIEAETFLRILAGYIQPDKGEIKFKSNPIYIKNVKDALKKGILMITNNACVAKDLTVKENLTLGLTNTVKTDAIQNALTLTGLDKIPLITSCKMLTAAQNSLLLLARALVSDAELFLFDSIDSAFDKSERESYAAVLRSLKSAGKSVLFIPAIFENMHFADRHLLLKDSKFIETNSTPDEINNTLYTLDNEDIFPVTEHIKQAKVVLEAIGLKGSILKDASINIRENKICGITGLKGSGLEEFLAIITGRQQAQGGVLTANKNNIKSKSLSSVKTVKAGIHIYNGIREYDLPLSARVNKISAFCGNIIVLLNPVLGLNTTDKKEFYLYLEELKKTSKAIILHTPSFIELQNVCDEIAIIYNGELSAVRAADNWNNEEIFKYVTSGKLEAFSIL